MATPNRYAGDRSRVVMAVALGAVNRGWSCDELYAAVMDPTNKGGAKVQEIARTRSRRAAQRYVRQAYEAARRRALCYPSAADPTSPDVVAVRQLADHLRQRQDVRWKGKAGATDFAVYGVHLTTAARVGRLTYTLDRRTIAEAIPCADPTVTASHRRLIHRGLLRRDDEGRGLRASTWTLLESAVTLPILLRSSLLPEGKKENGERDRRITVQPPAIIGNDAFVWAHQRRSGLGLSKRRVYETLGERPVTVRELATALGVRDRTARDHLGELERVGLAVRVGRRSWRRGTESTAAVAVRRGTAGATAYRRDLNVASRLLHRAGLALWTGTSTAQDDVWSSAGEVQAVALVC